MLAKKQRLTKKEFDHVFSSGKRYHSPALQLMYLPGDVFHGAVVVGKKVHKKAVDRNKLRRRLYAVLYQLHKKNSLEGTFILVVKPSIKEVPVQTLPQEVGAVLKQVVQK